MNIRQIKDRADDLLKDCKPQVIRTLIIMLLIGTIPSLIGYGNFLFSIISFALSILFISFSHGRIVTALKVARNNNVALSDDDALVGINRFKELFSTYFLIGLILFLAAFIIIFIGMFFFVAFFGAAFMNLSAVIGTVGSNNILSYTDLITGLVILGPTVILAFLLFIVFIVAVMLILSLYLYAAPYLLEQYHMKGLAAITESFAFIKGNVWNLFKLQISFLGWILLIAIINSILTELLVFIPILGVVIASLVSGGLAIYVYIPKYIVSMAIFFEEIAYYRYSSNQQGEMMNG